MKRKGATDIPPVEMLTTEEKLPCTPFGNRPCPFCGSAEISRFTSRMTEGVAWIQCDTCGATGPNKDVMAWNIRCDERGVSGPRDVLITFLNAKESAEKPE